MCIHLLTLLSLCQSEVEIQSLNETSRSRLWVHAVQLLPQNSFRENETLDTVGLEPAALSTTVIPVTVS